MKEEKQLNNQNFSKQSSLAIFGIFLHFPLSRRIRFGGNRYFSHPDENNWIIYVLLVLILLFILYLFFGKQFEKKVLNGRESLLNKANFAAKKKTVHIFLLNLTKDTLIVDREFLLPSNDFYIFQAKAKTKIYLSNGIIFHVKSLDNIFFRDARNQLQVLERDEYSAYNVPEYVDKLFVISDYNGETDLSESTEISKDTRET